MTPDDRIPEILRLVDLDALVARLGGNEAKRSGGTTTFHCPHPGHEDRTPSFTVKDGRWKCWSVCAQGGDAIDLLVWLRGLTKAAAIDELARHAGLCREQPPASTPPLSAAAQRELLATWCAHRGWGAWVVDELGLTVVADKFDRRRIRFSFRVAGQVPYWQDRLMGNGSQKYKYLSPSGAKPVPYEADRLVLAQERGYVFVLEGVTDVVAMVDTYTEPAVVGIPGVGAWRSSWAEAFAGLEVYVIGDNDQSGAGFRERLGKDLGPVARKVWQVMVPEDHNDVAAWRQGLDPEEFDRQLMASAEASAGHGVRIA